jgi:hypothetical protein
VPTAPYQDLTSPPRSKGIWFGNYCFTDPVLLPSFTPVCDSAVFAILVIDPACQPRAMRAIYFGESDRIHADLSPWHQQYQSWCRIAGSAIKLYVAFLWMKGSSPEERHAIVSDLIAQYQPECNAAC